MTWMAGVSVLGVCKRVLCAAAVVVLAVLVLLGRYSPLQAAAGEPMDLFVFVANRASSGIAVIDTRTDEVVTRIATDGIPLHLLASKERRRLITTGEKSRSLSVIDFDSGETVFRFPLGFVPATIDLGPDNRLLAIGDNQGTLSVISLEENRELFRLEGLTDPGYSMFGEKGERLFLSHRNSGKISVVDLASGRIDKVIPLDAQSAAKDGITHITRTPGGHYGFALHRKGGGVSILDLDSETAIRTVALPGAHWRAFPTVDSQYVLVPNSDDNSLSMISTRTRRESARFKGIREMTGVNTALFGSVAFAFGRKANDVTVIDLLEQRIIDRFSLPSAPETAATTTDGLKIYVALADSDQVAVIDVIRSKVVKLIDGVGSQPWAVFAAGALNYCH
jgi:YVTN family beta-propeller protein